MINKTLLWNYISIIGLAIAAIAVFLLAICIRAIPYILAVLAILFLVDYFGWYQIL